MDAGANPREEPASQYNLRTQPIATEKLDAQRALLGDGLDMPDEPHRDVLRDRNLGGGGKRHLCDWNLHNRI